MALPSTLVWEVRATGNNANGGAFKQGGSGTDYSQQDGPQATHDGSTLALTASGAGSTLSCPGRPFVSADTDNVLNVTGGTNLTIGRYHIVSVAAGVATLDRAVSTGASANGTGRLGGAIAAPGTAFSAGVASNIYYLKGDFTGVSGPIGPAGGTTADPTCIIGYTTTRSAADNPAVGGELASLTASASGTPVVSIASGTLVKNVSVDANGLANFCWIIAGNSKLRNCRSFNYLQRGFVFQGSSHQSADDCIASGGTGGSGTAADLRVGFGNTGGTLHCHRCVVSNGATNGFGTQNATIVLKDCVVTGLTQASSAGGHGVQIFGDGDFIVNNCTFNNLQGSGIFTNGGSSCENSHCQNSIFANISRHAFEGATGATALTTSVFADRYRYNAFYNVTLARQGGAVTVFGTGQNEITLTASPFNSSVDLGLNTTAGGGALLRQVGIPGAFSLLDTTTGYPDIGAVQAAVSSSAGSNASLMRTWWREWTNEEDTTRIPDSVVDIYLGRGMEALNDLVGFSWTDDTATTLVASTQEYSIPTDAIEIAWIEHNGRILDKGDVQEWERRGLPWRTEKAGTPREWAIYANKIVLLPAPNAAAVAASSTLTIRYVRCPRDFTTYGPEQLSTQHLRLPVYYGVAEWLVSPNGVTAAGMGAQWFMERFKEESEAVRDSYAARRLAR